MKNHHLIIYGFVVFSLISILILVLCVIIPDHLSPLIGIEIPEKPVMTGENDTTGQYQQNTSSSDSLAGISLYGAIDIATSDARVEEWLSSHPGYGISQASSDSMYLDGSSCEWHIMFAQGKDAVIVPVDNDNVTGIIEHSSYSTGAQVMNKSEMQDSTMVMKNFSFIIGQPDTGNYVASFRFYSENGGGIYELSYADPVDNSRDFEVVFNARDGSIIRSEFKGDWWLGA